MTCERCGNDFNWGKRIEREGKPKILCPYCFYHNDIPRSSKKKKKFKVEKVED